MNGGIAILVKTPGLSPVKTRLATGLGTAAAERWHRLAAAAVAEIAGGVAGLTAYWALAEPADRAAGAWRGLPVLEQGEGELGERMGRVHAALLGRHDFALLLGADSPQLEAQHLADAAAWLDAAEPRLVMGPAGDGGFWLLGGNRNPAPADWMSSPCGRHDTARGFRIAMARHGEWRLLPVLTDVDEATDLSAMLDEMALLKHPSPAQARLAAWSRAALAE
jgi:uncharacterized protein